jgi:HSP20 family protein
MYNLENKKNNNYLSMFDDFNSFFDEVLGKDMKTNILEKDDAYVVTSEIPGVSKENIKIDVADNNLTISVSKKDNKETKEKKNYLVKEISEASYNRTFYLEDMDEDNISAKMDNGILTITVGKVKEVKPKVRMISID